MFKILMPDKFLALIKPSTKGENVWLDFLIKTYRKSWLLLMETPNVEITYSKFYYKPLPE